LSDASGTLTAMALTAVQLRRRRFAAQGLHAASRSAVDVVRKVLAVQAQDLKSAHLSVRARSTGLVVGDVDAALQQGKLVVSWLMRGTLHLVHRDDYASLWALTAPGTFAGTRRRLGQEGVSPADAETALEIIELALAADGPLPRADLAMRIARAGVRTEGQAMPHLLTLAALRGLVVLGPVRDGAQAFALTRDWLGFRPAPLSAGDRRRALAELVRRYLAGHGPATAADIATWAGLGVRDIRLGLHGSDLSADGEFVDLAGRERPAGQLPARLLPAFDPYLLGWRDRSFAVPDAHRRRVYPGGGMLRATAVVDGRAVGTWTVDRGRDTVEITPFDELDATAAAALRAESDDVARFEQR
jgi:hypothetical protein